MNQPAPDQPASDQPAERVIDLSIEVVGTPEQVWEAIATGPGISSWFVPTTVEEREGGDTTSRFGPGAEMLIPGRVAAWEPPRRVHFVGDGPDSGLAFEWLVEARDGGTCIVRLVNSGFGSGEEWDAQFDGMSEGWVLFLHNLQLHCRHFAGQAGTASLPMGLWAGPRERAWAALLDALGAPGGFAAGQRVTLGGGELPTLTGTVESAGAWRASLVLDEPCPGTAIIAAEGHGEQVGMSLWQYLYGPDADAVIARDEPRWQAWLAGGGAT